MTFIILALVITWHIIGLPVAKMAYRNAVRTHRLNPQIGAGERPARPLIKVNETLHQSGINRKTNLLDHTLTRCSLMDGGRACSCKYRDEWLTLREQWRLYNEWKPAEVVEPTPARFVWTVPFWPLVLANRYISEGAKGIPDPKRLERVRIELAEVEEQLKELDSGNL